jgi:hypothetical protein
VNSRLKDASLFRTPPGDWHPVGGIEAGIDHVAQLHGLVEQPLFLAVGQIVRREQSTKVTNRRLEHVEFFVARRKVDLRHCCYCFVELILHIHDPECVEAIDERGTPSSKRRF